MSEEKSIRVIVFDGKQENWRQFKLKCLAKANYLGYRSIFDGDDDIPKESDVLDDSTDAGKKSLKLRMMNANAYAALCLSCEGSAFGCIERAFTSDLPNGDGRLAWKNLCDKYEPKTQLSMVSLKKEFADCKLESVKTDPDDWVNKLEHIRSRIAGVNSAQKIDDDGMVAHILANLPKAYSEFITMMDSEMDSGTANVTIDKLVTRLRNFYRRKFAHAGPSGTSEGGDEIALTAFKGLCRSCGKYGHKSTECKSKDKKNSGTTTSTSGGNKSDLTCTYCQKKGHTAEQCWKKQKDDKKAKGSESADIALTSISVDDIVLSAIVKDKDFFLFDSGATSHMTNSEDGLLNTRAIDRDVQVGNGEIVKATKIGSLKTTLEDVNGKKVSVLLNDVSFVPDLKFNLLSVGKIASNGASIVYKKEGAFIDFDTTKIALKSIANGAVYGLSIDRVMAIPALDIGKTIDMKQAHAMFGHAGEDATKQSASHFGLKVVGSLGLCDACAIAKGKQKNVSKESTSTTQGPGEKLYIDVSSVSAVSIGGSKFMAMIVDDYSKMKWSMFLKKKSDLCGQVLPLIKTFNSTNKTVQKIRMDNAGENKQLGDEVKQMGIVVEYTAPNTPQQNGVAERAIATVVSRARAMMSHSGLSKELKEKLWAECFATSTKLSNVVVVGDDKTPYELFYGEGHEPKWLRFMKPFGMVGYITNRSDIKSKLQDRAYKSMFVGYSDDHEGDCYRFYKFDTEHIVMSRDVRWTDKFFGQSEMLSLEDSDILTSGTDEVQIQGIEEAVVDVDDAAHGVEVQQNEQVHVEQLNEEYPPQGRTLRSGRNIGTQRDIELFNQFGSRGAADIQKNDQHLGDGAEASAANHTGTPTQIDRLDDTGTTTEIVDLALVACINSTMAEPKTYAAAMASPDKFKWIDAMRTEYTNIKEKKVWRIIKKSKVQQGKTILGTKWVFKIKGDGRYRARLVVKGYNQIPGVDFTESHSPVANDVTIRLLLVLVIIYHWMCETIDVETAFLYGLLQELVYLHLPDGINEIGGEETSADDVVVLDKALYGLVQASRVWLNTLIAYLLSIGFQRSRADPCLLWRSGIDGFVVFLVYVDDCLICGSKEGVRNCIRDIKQRFNISEMGALNEYVGAKYKRVNGTYHISQSAMIEEFPKVFDLKGERPSTPAIPSQVLLKSTPNDVKLDAADQTVFRSGVGKLLYLTKLSRPDMSSAVRELATHMDGANEEHKKALFRALEYAVHTKYKILTLNPKMSMEGQIVGYSDSNYASNKDTRRSVSGFAIYYMGGLVSWKSKAQNCVTMSSTEAEYVAMSSCAMEMMFIKQVVESINFEVKLPMILYCDNAGAIDLARNYSTGGRTKHIDVRHHYIRELIDKGFIKIEFVGTDDNISDIFTKGLSLGPYDKHSNSLGMKVDDSIGEDVED